MELELNWNGIGTELERNWNGIGMELEQNWNGIGMELEFSMPILVFGIRCNCVFFQRKAARSVRVLRFEDNSLKFP